MAVSNCVRCLFRPHPTTLVPRRLVARTVSPTPIRLFSTTQAVQVLPPKKKTAQAQASQVRKGPMKKNYGKGKTLPDRSKCPAPGERKAYRKRIVLSNNNALPVEGLDEINLQSLADPANAGRVMALPNEVIDQLRAIEAFKPTQTWSMFRKPSTLVRPETVDLVRRMQEAADKKTDTLRLVLTGNRISGKSVLQLQAMTHAYLNNWIVVNIPEAHELTRASTEYARIPGSEPALWMQHAYALKMMQSMREANRLLFESLKTVRPHPDLAQHVPVGSTLARLAGHAKEADTAWPIFQALWQELTIKGEGRPPVLFCLDGLSHIMRISEYRTPAFELIHAHDLALVRLFTDCLSGKPDMLPNGGVVLAATSRGNAQRAPSMELALRQREAEKSGQAVPQREAYGRGYDDRVEQVLKTVGVMDVKAVSKSEARALMEYWAASGMLRETVDEQAVSERWAVGGNGNLGEMERAALLSLRI